MDKHTRELEQELEERSKTELIIRYRLELMEFAVKHSLTELLQKTLDCLAELTDSAIGFYHFVDDDQKNLTLQAWSTRTAAEFCKAEGKGLHYSIDQAGVWVDCVHERRPIIHNDYASLPQKKGLPRGHAAVIRELVVPILKKDKIVAILGVGNKPGDYTQNDVQIVSYLADVVWEIVEKLRNEEALLTSETKFRTLYESSNEAVFLVNESGIIDCNISTVRMFGCRDKQEFCANHPVFLFPEQPTGRDSLLTLANLIERGIREGSSDFECCFRKYDSTKSFHAEVQVTRMKLDREVVLQLTVRDISKRKLIENAQTFLLQCGLPSSGEDFFEMLARYLAENLGMQFVCIDRLEGDGLTAETVAVYNDGHFESNVRYSLKDTPCGEVVDKFICCYPRYVRQLFPRDTALQELKAESYFGALLWDSKGCPIGLIALIGQQELDEQESAETLLKLVAPRAAGELERRKAEEELRSSQKFIQNILETTPNLIYIYDLQENRNVYSNNGMINILGYSPEEVRKQGNQLFANILHPEDFTKVIVHHSLLASASDDTVHEVEYRMKHAEGHWVTLHSRDKPFLRDDQGKVKQITGTARDITEQKQMDLYRGLPGDVLAVLNKSANFLDSFNNVLAIIKRTAECDAVGIRLQKGCDFPYFVQKGFSGDFILAENSLILRDEEGRICRDSNENVSLECTCGLVISGKTDSSSPFFTQGGSCWTNETLPPGIFSINDTRLHPRDRCLHEGYLSVALIPIRQKDRIVGLLQLNDRRKGRFNLNVINILEGITSHIGEALLRWEVEEELNGALARSRRRAEEVSALLGGARIVFDNSDFYKASSEIFDICRSLIGAMAGYLALLSADGQQNQILFLEAGDRSSKRAPTLNIPIKGLQEEAYRLCETIYDNDCMNSPMMDDLPEGHIQLENILFAPLLVNGKAQGVLVLANKPNGFTENDQRIVSAFAELTAVSLRNSQMLDSLMKKEISLKQAHNELEKRVHERTQDLTLAYEQLKVEVEERQRAEGSLKIQRDLHTILSASNEALLLGTDQDTIIQSICEVAVQSGLLQLAWVGFPDREGRLEIAASSGPSVDYLEGIEITLSGETGQGPTGICLRTNQTRINDDFLTDPTLSPWRQRAIAYGLRSSVGLPIREGNRCIGALTLYSTVPGFFSGERITLLEQLASNLSYALDLLKAEERTKMAIETLRASEEKYRIVADNTHDWEFWIDPQGEFLYISQACEKITGHSPEEFAANPELLQKIIHPDDLEEFLAHRHSVAENMSSETLTFRILHPDGQERWIEHLCQPVFDKTGFFLGHRGSNRDITARKQAEIQVLQSKKMLQAVFDGIAEPLTLMDKNMIVRMVNIAAVDYFNLNSPLELIGKSGCRMTDAKINQCATCPIPSAVFQGQRMNFIRNGYMDPDRVESVSIFPISAEHGPEAGAVIRILDITEAKMMEKSLLRTEKLASIGVLSSGIAHEINNPNNFIMFNVPVLRRYLHALLPLVKEHAAVHGDPALFGVPFDEFEKDVFELAESIEKGSERIKNIVAELKNFSAIDIQEETTWGNPEDTIRQAIRISRVQLKDRVKRLEVDIQQEPLQVYFESRALEQVIVNILINAAQASDKEESLIILKAKVDREKRHFVIKISDNGCGIDEKSLKKIFDPFYTTKPPGLGTGLGLYVCHNMMQKMEGRINVESRVGQGTTFYLALRCRQERRH